MCDQILWQVLVIASPDSCPPDVWRVNRGVAISKLPIVEIASVAEFTLSAVEGLPRNDNGPQKMLSRTLLVDNEFRDT